MYFARTLVTQRMQDAAASLPAGYQPQLGTLPCVADVNAWGGLVTSTLLTLIVLPVVYAWLEERWTERCGGWRDWRGRPWQCSSRPACAPGRLVASGGRTRRRVSCPPPEVRDEREADPRECSWPS